MGNDGWDGYTEVGKGGKAVSDKGKSKGKGKNGFKGFKGKGNRSYLPFGGRVGNKPYGEAASWWDTRGKSKKTDPYTFCSACGSFTWDRKKGPTCDDCGCSWPIWDKEDPKEAPAEPPKVVLKEQPEGGKGAGKAEKQEPKKYGEHGNPGGKAESRDEARRVLGEANAAYAKIQGSVQRLQKELKEGEASIARMVTEVLAKRQKMQEKHLEVVEETAKLDEAKVRRRTIEDKEHEACYELNMELARNLEPARFANLGKITKDGDSMEAEDAWFGVQNENRGCEGRSSAGSQDKGARGTSKGVGADERATTNSAPKVTDKAPEVAVPEAGRPALVLGSKPVVASEDAKPEEIEEDNRFGHGGMLAMEGGGDESDEDSDNATELGYSGSMADDDESHAGDREIDSKESWTDAMVDFIWQAKDKSELPTQCPELANWLNVWNDADNETGKETAKELLDVVQQGIEKLQEKRNQYHFDMQSIEANAAGGNVEVAERDFKLVGAYAEQLRGQFGEWIRTEITSKLDKLAGAREAAVTDGSATSRVVKIAKSKLRAKVPRRQGTEKGRKGCEAIGGASGGTKKTHAKKKKPPAKAAEEPKDN